MSNSGQPPVVQHGTKNQEELPNDEPAPTMPLSLPSVSVQTSPVQQTPEIWSTRLQREISALLRSPGQDGRKKDFSRLPSFASIENHNLDIPGAACTITFRIEVDRSSTNVHSLETTGEVDIESQENSSTMKDEQDFVEVDEPFVLITLDTTIQRNSHGIREASHNSYPFQKPKCVLTRGSKLFPRNCGLKDGDFLPIDFDWTPSLHLVDAVCNVGLKIRESIKKGDPFIQPDLGEMPTGVNDGNFFEELSIQEVITDIGDRLKGWWAGSDRAHNFESS